MNVEPVIAPLMTDISLTLSYLVGVVRECVVNTAAVEVKIFSQMLHAYAGALDMPAGISHSPRTVPFKLLIVKLGLSEPENEIRLIALVSVLVNTLFWASNFSIGVAIFSAVNRYLAKIMDGFPQYDVEMEEVHHIHKLDAPSGTAITLAEEIVADLDRKSDWTKGTLLAPDGTLSGEKQAAADKLRIDSIRRDEVPGIHTIKYDSEADSITITHDAHSRKGFALGAVLAAEFTKDHKGLLTISDMFKF